MAESIKVRDKKSGAVYEIRYDGTPPSDEDIVSILDQKAGERDLQSGLTSAYASPKPATKPNGLPPGTTFQWQDVKPTPKSKALPGVRFRTPGAGDVRAAEARDAQAAVEKKLSGSMTPASTPESIRAQDKKRPRFSNKPIGKDIRDMTVAEAENLFMLPEAAMKRVQGDSKGAATSVRRGLEAGNRSLTGRAVGGVFGDTVDGQGAGGAFNRNFQQGIVPGAGGLAGFAAGSRVGAQVPGNALVKGAASLAGGLGGAFLGSGAAAKVQDAGLNLLLGNEGMQALQQQRGQDFTNNPLASNLGQAATALVFGRPTSEDLRAFPEVLRAIRSTGNLSAALSTPAGRALSEATRERMMEAGVEVVAAAGESLVTGKPIDWANTGLQALSGALLPGENRLGTRFTHGGTGAVDTLGGLLSSQRPMPSLDFAVGMPDMQASNRFTAPPVFPAPNAPANALPTILPTISDVPRQLPAAPPASPFSMLAQNPVEAPQPQATQSPLMDILAGLQTQRRQSIAPPRPEAPTISYDSLAAMIPPSLPEPSAMAPQYTAPGMGKPRANITVEPAFDAPQSEWDAYNKAWEAENKQGQTPPSFKPIEQQKQERLQVRENEYQKNLKGIPAGVRRGAVFADFWERYSAQKDYQTPANRTSQDREDTAAYNTFLKGTSTAQKKALARYVSENRMPLPDGYSEAPTQAPKAPEMQQAAAQKLGDFNASNRIPTLDEQRLINNVMDGENYLKGRMDAEKRAAVERQVAKDRQRLEDWRKENLTGYDAPANEQKAPQTLIAPEPINTSDNKPARRKTTAAIQKKADGMQAAVQEARKPNSVIVLLRGAGGEARGVSSMQYDGTEEGARAAHDKIMETQGVGGDSYYDPNRVSNIQTLRAATDSEGNIKYVISPNGNVHEWGSDGALYALGDLAAGKRLEAQAKKQIAPTPQAPEPAKQTPDSLTRPAEPVQKTAESMQEVGSKVKPLGKTGTVSTPEDNPVMAPLHTERPDSKPMTESEAEYLQGKPKASTGLTARQEEYLGDRLKEILPDLPEKTTMVMSDMKRGDDDVLRRVDSNRVVTGEPFDKKKENDNTGFYTGFAPDAKPVSIKVPGDGTFRVGTRTQAENLLKAIGQNAPKESSDALLSALKRDFAGEVGTIVYSERDGQGYASNTHVVIPVDDATLALLKKSEGQRLFHKQDDYRNPYTRSVAKVDLGRVWPGESAGVFYPEVVAINKDYDNVVMEDENGNRHTYSLKYYQVIKRMGLSIARVNNSGPLTPALLKDAEGNSRGVLMPKGAITDDLPDLIGSQRGYRAPSEAEANVATAPAKKGKATTEAKAAALEAKKEAATAKIKKSVSEAGTRLYSNPLPPPELIQGAGEWLAAEIGLRHLRAQESIKDKAQATRLLMNEFGDWIRPHAEKIIEEARARFGALVAEPLKQEGRDVPDFLGEVQDAGRVVSEAVPTSESGDRQVAGVDEAGGGAKGALSTSERGETERLIRDFGRGEYQESRGNAPDTGGRNHGINDVSFGDTANVGQQLFLHEIAHNFDYVYERGDVKNRPLHDELWNMSRRLYKGGEEANGEIVGKRELWAGKWLIASGNGSEILANAWANAGAHWPEFKAEAPQKLIDALNRVSDAANMPRPEDAYKLLTEEPTHHSQTQERDDAGRFVAADTMEQEQTDGLREPAQPTANTQRAATAGADTTDEPLTTSRGDEPSTSGTSGEAEAQNAPAEPANPAARKLLTIEVQQEIASELGLDDWTLRAEEKMTIDGLFTSVSQNMDALSQTIRAKLNAGRYSELSREEFIAAAAIRTELSEKFVGMIEAGKTFDDPEVVAIASEINDYGKAGVRTAQKAGQILRSAREMIDDAPGGFRRSIDRANKATDFRLSSQALYDLGLLASRGEAAQEALGEALEAKATTSLPEAKDAVKRYKRSTPAKKATDPNYGKDNTVFTREKYEAAKALLEQAKNPTRRGATLPSPVYSPAEIAAMRDIGGFHFEAGLRRFGEWASQVRSDVGRDIEDSTLGRVWNDVVTKQRRFMTDAEYDAAKKSRIDALAQTGKPVAGAPRKANPLITQATAEYAKNAKSFEAFTRGLEKRLGIGTNGEKLPEALVRDLFKEAAREFAKDSKQVEAIKRRLAAQIESEILKSKPALYRRIVGLQQAKAKLIALRASYDTSFLGRQGGKIVAARPGTGAKAFVEGMRTLRNPDLAASVDAEIAADMEGYAHKPDFTLRGGEENTEAVNMDGPVWTWLKEHGIDRSEEANRTILNRLRLDYFKSLAKPTDPPEYQKAMADLVNIMSSRGDMKYGEKDISQIVRVAHDWAQVWSPRNNIANLQFLALQPIVKPALAGALAPTPEARAANRRAALAAAREYARYAGTVGLFLAMLGGIARSFGWDDWLQVDMNPRSKDFGKVRAGQLELDFTAGWRKHWAFVNEMLGIRQESEFDRRERVKLESIEARKLLAKGQTTPQEVAQRQKAQNFEERNRGNILESYGRSMLNPLAGEAATQYLGRDFKNEPVKVFGLQAKDGKSEPRPFFNAGEAAKRWASQVGPISLTQWTDAIRENGYPLPPETARAMAAGMAFEFIGVGAGARDRSPETAAKQDTKKAEQKQGFTPASSALSKMLGIK